MGLSFHYYCEAEGNYIWSLIFFFWCFLLYHNVLYSVFLLLPVNYVLITKNSISRKVLPNLDLFFCEARICFQMEHQTAVFLGCTVNLCLISCLVFHQYCPYFHRLLHIMKYLYFVLFPPKSNIFHFYKLTLNIQQQIFVTFYFFLCCFSSFRNAYFLCHEYTYED